MVEGVGGRIEWVYLSFVEPTDLCFRNKKAVPEEASKSERQVPSFGS